MSGLKKNYVVFGLGRYGLSVAKELVKNGADVLAIDINEDNVNNAAVDLPICKCADATDPKVMKQLGIANFDVAIVCMAGDLEASVMTVVLCKENGVKTIIAKCSNEMHQKVLTAVGASKVVIPEYESGVRLAKSLLSAGFVDAVNLSEDISIVDINTPKSWVGKTLIELGLRKKYSINIIAIEKDGNTSIDVDPNAKLIEGTKLIIIAHAKKIQKLLKDLS